MATVFALLPLPACAEAPGAAESIAAAASARIAISAVVGGGGAEGRGWRLCLRDTIKPVGE